MKRFAAIFFLVFLGVLVVHKSACAQSIFASPWTISGTTNSPIFQTNITYVYFPQRTFYFSNVTNTNGIFIGSYQVALPGQTNPFTLGSTNITFSATGSVAVVIPPMTFPVTNNFSYNAIAGTNTYGVLAP